MTEYTFTYDSGGERYKIIETARTETEAIRKAEQRAGCEVTVVAKKERSDNSGQKVF